MDLKTTSGSLALPPIAICPNSTSADELKSEVPISKINVISANHHFISSRPRCNLGLLRFAKEKLHQQSHADMDLDLKSVEKEQSCFIIPQIDAKKKKNLSQMEKENNYFGHNLKESMESADSKVDKMELSDSIQAKPTKKRVAKRRATTTKQTLTRAQQKTTKGKTNKNCLCFVLLFHQNGERETLIIIIQPNIPLFVCFFVFFNTKEETETREQRDEEQIIIDSLLQNDADDLKNGDDTDDNRHNKRLTRHTSKTARAKTLPSPRRTHAIKASDVHDDGSDKVTTINSSFSWLFYYLFE